MTVIAVFAVSAVVVGVVGVAAAISVALYRRSATNVQQLKRQAATLAEQAQLLDLAHDAILVWDIKTGAIQFWNRGSEMLYGWSKSEVLGRTPQAVLQTGFPKPLEEINAELIDTRRWEGELVHTRRDGSRVVVASRWALQVDDRGQPVAVLGINSDITSRKAAEAALEQQALHDDLTGLPNRTLFRDRLERALALADRHDRPVAVLFLDLDNFKVINDSLGHQAGDTLLIEVAQRLRDCLRASDTVARLGGDEFTLLLAEIANESEAHLVAERIGAAVRAPMRIADRDVIVSASIGVALSTPRRTHPDSLLRNADVAMYRSKAAGKARHSMFDADMNKLAIERLELETDLRQALANDEFRIHYQPIYDLADGELVEVEALLRWERPGHGLMTPATFIPLAEETGLIVPIGRWVIQQACRQARAWNMTFDPRLVMGVNLSAGQFRDPDLVNDIAATIDACGLDPRNLKLEISESVAMQDVETTVKTLQALKALGAQLAMDDFGTGYSSLGYLKRFPVDTLKIDGSFVAGLGVDVQDTAIVQSVVALAKVLNLSVVGEGIERPAQAAHLQAIGCERGQGFLFAKPQPADSMALLLEQQRALEPAARAA